MSTQAKVTVDAKQAKSELKELTKETQEFTKAAQDAAQAGAKLGESIKPQKTDEEAFAPLNDLLTQIKGLGKEVTAVEAGGSAATKALGGMGKMAGAVGGVALALGGAAVAARSFVKEAADAGNTDFQRVEREIAKIGSAWRNLVDNIADTSLGKWFANHAADAAKWSAETVAAIRYVGKEFEDVQKVDEQRLHRQQRGRFAEVERDIRAKMRNEEDVADARKLKSVEEVTAAIEEQLKKLSDRANALTIDAKAEESARKRMEVLIHRRRELTHELEAAEKRSAAEKKRALEDEEKHQKQIIEQGLREQFRAWDEARRREDADFDERLEKAREGITDERALHNELARQSAAASHRSRKAAEDAAATRKMAMEKVGTEEFRLLDQLADAAERAADRAAKAVEDAEMRKLNAAQQALQKQIQGMQNAGIGQALMQQDPHDVIKRLAENAGKAAGDDAAANMAERDGATQGDVDRARERAERDARRRAFRQAKNQFEGRGPQGENAPFSPEQIQDAMLQNANAVIDSMVGTNKVGWQNVDALREVAQAQAIHDQELAKQSQEIANINRFLKVTTENARQRAQRKW